MTPNTRCKHSNTGSGSAACRPTPSPSLRPKNVWKTKTTDEETLRNKWAPVKPKPTRAGINSHLISPQQAIDSRHKVLEPQIVTRVPLVQLFLQNTNARHQQQCRHALHHHKTSKISLEKAGGWCFCSTHQLEHVRGVDFVSVAHEANRGRVSLDAARHHGSGEPWGRTRQLARVAHHFPRRRRLDIFHR